MLITSSKSSTMISIVIPTRNRKESLKKCLLSLASLDFPLEKYEVIVVDDDSSDGTTEFLENMRTILPFDLKLVRHSTHKGVSAARNLAIQIAKGEIIASTDDDCLVPPDWLSLLTASFSSSEVGMTGGPDMVPEKSSFFSRCVDYLYTSFIGTGGLRQRKKIRLGKYFPKIIFNLIY